MNPAPRIHQIVNDFVANVAQVARQVASDTLNTALASTAPLARAPSTTKRTISRAASATKAGRRAVGLRKGEKRSARDLERLKIRFVDHVKANPGRRIEQINRELGTRTAELRRPVAQLVKTKEIKTKGRLRATTYFAAG